MATSRCVQRKVDAGSSFAGSLFCIGEGVIHAWRGSTDLCIGGGLSTHGVDLLPTPCVDGRHPCATQLHCIATKLQKKLD